jgi:ATP-dependent DNA ligase
MLQYIYPCKPNRLDRESALLQSLDNDPSWIAEVKRNGWRCIARKDDNGRLSLWTRHHALINDPLQELREQLNGQLQPGTMIDGELLERRTKTVKGEYYVFDLMFLTGQSCMHLPLIERHRLLIGAVLPTNHITIAEQHITDKILLYERSISTEDCEGIVIKRIASKYIGSLTRCEQHPYWLKVKRPEAHTRKVQP